jgi:catechol 2,3-dioxygenase-like lactoylglutathione lyase family enzyme
MFDKIALISIPVKDQKAAISFYTEKLGCNVKEEMPFGTPDTVWIRLTLPGVTTEIVLATWFPQMKPGCVQGLVLTTKNIADTHMKLRKRKLEISDITKQPWGQEATFSDPDGNGWVLQQSG